MTRMGILSAPYCSHQRAIIINCFVIDTTADCRQCRTAANALRHNCKATLKATPRTHCSGNQLSLLTIEAVDPQLPILIFFTLAASSNNKITCCTIL